MCVLRMINGTLTATRRFIKVILLVFDMKIRGMSVELMLEKV